MSYSVVHSERYLVDKKETEYSSLEKIKERYSVYWNYVKDEISALNVGDSVDVHYDDYVSLNVKKVS